MHSLEKWKRLQDESALYRAVSADQEESYWSKYALNYDLRRHWGNRVHSELETVLTLLKPSMSVLEIGAGTGAYTLPVANMVHTVSVVEPSISMIHILEEKLKINKIQNVQIYQSKWEDFQAHPHDIVLTAGCMYVFYDVRAALEKMLQSAKQMLILSLGVHNRFSIYEEAARFLETEVPQTGPDYFHLYHVLYEMGICANVNIVSSKANIIYDDLEHAVNVWKDRMKLPAQKSDLLRNYLNCHLYRDQSGKLTLGELSGLTAILWYKKDRENRIFPDRPVPVNSPGKKYFLYE